MSDEGLELTRLRNNFYRDNYRKIMMLLMVFTILLAVLVSSLLYLFFNRPEPKYFAATASGRILNLVPLNRPTVTPDVLLKWASEVATSAYSYSFANYRTKLQGIQPYFTDTGWTNFINSLKGSGNIGAIEKRKLIVNAVVSAPPVIIKEAVLNGRYAWKVQVPITVNYQSASESFPSHYYVTMVIIRVSTLQNENGIGVAQFIQSSASS
jgi:intracellular multiplication protein IcmL